MGKHRECVACLGPTNETKTEKVNKSKDVLDIRIVPGDTNAWVECYENTFDEDAVVGNAEYNAQIENVRLQQHLLKKHEKLKSFQNEVKRRVSNLERLKREDAQQKYLKRVEDEHNLVLQRTLGIRLPYQGSPDELQHLNKELLKSCIIPCNNDKQLQTIICEVEKSDQKVDEMANVISKENVSARLRLLSKKASSYDTELPGGNWKSPSQRQTTPLKVKSAVPTTEEKNENTSHRSNVLIDSEQFEEKKSVSFDRDSSLQPNMMTESNDLQTNIEEDQLKNRLNFIYEVGKSEEVEKMQKQNQYWKFRKLFMEIERDQVKEKKKIKDHRKRVQSLKLVKEEERKKAEKKMTRFSEKPVQNPPPNETQSTHKSAILIEKKSLQEKEMYRYMEALRKVAKERIEICNVAIPPLCSCGPSFWDSHPDKCANNCAFYKNIKVYVSALTSALASTR